MQNKGRRREGFDYFVDKGSYDNNMPNQTISPYNSYNDSYFNSNGNSFLQNQNNFEDKKYVNVNENYGLEYPIQTVQPTMQTYSSVSPQYPENNNYYGNGFENNDQININNRRFSNNSFNNGFNENSRMDGTIEFSAFPGQGGLNPNERPLGDQTLMFSSSELPSSYNNRNNNAMANRYVEQIIKTQQIQLNEQKKEISKKFDNIDQVLNNISRKVDNVNRTIANTATLSFNNIDPRSNAFEEYDSNPYLDSKSNKKDDTIETTQHLKTSVLNEMRNDYENDVVKFKQKQINSEKIKANVDKTIFDKEEEKLAKTSGKSKQKKGLVIGIIIFLTLIVLSVVLVLILTFGKVIK